MAVGNVEEVHMVLFGKPTFAAFSSAASMLFGSPIESEEEEDEEEVGGQADRGGSAAPGGVPAPAAGDAPSSK